MITNEKKARNHADDKWDHSFVNVGSARAVGT
jgi:hypothetical protein